MIIAAVLLLSVPMSMAAGGRARLNKVEAPAYSREDTDAEVEFGRRVAARILGKFPLLQSSEVNRYVGLIGTGLAAAGGRPDLEYKFAVLDTDVPNAFAAPGGYVFITKGALLKMGDEAELAAVLGHEIAHISRRHIVRELNIKSSGGDMTSGLAQVIGGVGGVSRVALGKFVDMAESILFSRGYAIDDEHQADRDAIMLAGAVGYDTRGLPRYLEKVDAAGREPASVKATHPALAERKNRIEALMASDGLDKAKGPDMKERFNENVKLR